MRSRFPVSTPYAEALKHAPKHLVNTNQILLWVRDTFMRDTPFSYRDVYEVFQELESYDPGRFTYTRENLRQVLSWFKRSGQIYTLDDHHTLPEDYVYLWTAYYKRHTRERRDPCPKRTLDWVSTLS
jgi:hypothetical protein